MEHFRRPAISPARLGILPGTFNPVTIAHVALAQSALTMVDQVVFVLPRVFPHKEYVGASFEERVDMLAAALGSEPRFSVAVTEGGLFAEIAAECRAAYGSGTRLSFLCGSDAAARIAGWDYGSPGAFADMLDQFDLLVADRGEVWTPMPAHARGVRRLVLPADFADVSASEVRARILKGERWEHLVPEAVRERVGQIYRGGNSSRQGW
jgi:nicotinate-nucleotide adenylyltransferase